MLSSPSRDAPAPPSPPESETPDDVLDTMLEKAFSRHQGAHPGYSFGSENVPEEHRPPIIKKVSTLPYGVSNSRTSGPVSRWLIVAVPSLPLGKEPVLLGHTLSTSPAGRFRDGILMPLLPTMYGQLLAIAREYGMPSTVGICLYLQSTSTGTISAPRISDESWPYLWGHLGDVTSASMGPPIAGRVEFDIDLRKARWTDAWLGIHRSERSPLDTSAGTLLTDVVLREPSQHIQRLPRRPSAADRTGNNDEPHIASLKTTSPLDEEGGLMDRVKNWRESAESSGHTLSSKTPDELDLNEFAWTISSEGPPSPQLSAQMAASPIQSIHLISRLAGSVCITPSIATSFGPDDSIGSSRPASSIIPLRSPDIGQRMLDDVPCTPTTATSWGPPSIMETMESEEDDNDSVDIALRCLQDESIPHCAEAQTGKPHWGWPYNAAPGSLAASDKPFRKTYNSLPYNYPMLVIYAPVYPNIDLYPPHISPGVPNTAQKADVAGNVTSTNLVTDYPRIDIYPACQATKNPNIDPQSGAYPNFELYPQATTGLLLDSPSQSIESHGPAYPILVMYANVYPFLAPYVDLPTEVREGKKRSLVQRGAKLPNTVNAGLLATLGDDYPHIIPYPPVSRPFNRFLSTLSPVERQCTKFGDSHLQPVAHVKYPQVVVYPPVYPCIELYPEVELGGLKLSTSAAHSRPSTQSQAKTVGYPNVTLYLSRVWEVSTASVGYPNMILYPSLRQRGLDAHKSTIVIVDYPNITLYPPVVQEVSSAPEMSTASVAYPNIILYPSLIQEESDAHKTKLATIDYPHISLYPPVVREGTGTREMSTASVAYPNIILYPSLIQEESDAHKTKLATIDYPHISLYPPVVREGTGTREWSTASVGYPNIILYPSLIQEESDAHKTKLATIDYPHISLYPPVVREGTGTREWSTASVGYPDIILYPSLVQEELDAQKTVIATVDYPNISLYPATTLEGLPAQNISAAIVDYPSIILYAPLAQEDIDAQIPTVPTGKSHITEYPNLDPYPAVRRVSCRTLTSVDRVTSPSCMFSYPFIRLYDPVYTFMELYPTLSVADNSSELSTKTVATPVKNRRTHRQLHDLVFSTWNDQSLPESQLSPVRSHQSESQPDVGGVQKKKSKLRRFFKVIHHK